MFNVTAHGASIPALGFGVFRMSDEEVERIVPRHSRSASATSTLHRSMRMKLPWAVRYRRRQAEGPLSHHQGVGRQLRTGQVRRFGG
jgi:hypothetical protein